MSTEIDVNSEPLPGYRLIERIGSGGYGEVWRAEAPGGLTKAIKFVFGQQHEKRAVNESRALEHLRGVRHPFLLSLERIEVVDGRLLIVSELADSSVKDRFDQCRRENLRGIPRDELLGYLRDAADALDFMSNAHQLQHLDIKPENLLLLAGHVKVADFGLVKDVRQSQASLVGGMTPLYAAPEVFRGSPSRYSDQYSLAIVYQEMLTGTLPFVGNSAAELTLHHLNDEPDLTSLAAADRYVVSRALSKDAPHRYSSCREFVDSLVKVATPTANAIAAADGESFGTSVDNIDAKNRETQPADFCDDEQPAGWSGSSSQILLGLPANDCQLVDLPAVDLESADPRPTPTLLLGIGGTAGRVIGQLRRMMCDQWGSPRDLPAVQYLLVDTDAQDLASTARGDASSLRAEEVLALPLQRPQHYRENSQQLLHWISRRWLYNIPRSLRTEGLRPLGRLALADHARNAGQRMRRAMVQALDPESISKSNATTGQQFRTDALRVVVVASISGGTGGGMSLDMGYAVRAILQKLGLAQAEVLGVMLHSTGRDARQGELARVNAFAWLSEYHHFQQFDNPYPGDVSCGLPSHAAGVPAFDHTYLVQLGDNLDGDEFDQATQAVADYLRLNTVSPASGFFDACRNPGVPKSSQQSSRPGASLRSFGLHRQAQAVGAVDDEVTSLICQHVLSTWTGAADSASPQSIDADQKHLVQRLHLDVAGIAGNARSLIEITLGMPPSQFLAASLAGESGPGAGNPAAELNAIDRMFSRENSAAGSNHVSLLGLPEDEIVAPLADKLVAEVRRWVSRRIDIPGQRLAGARQAANWVVEHFGRVESELQQISEAIANRLNQIRTDASAAAKKASTKGGPQAAAVSRAHSEEYFQVSLDALTIIAARHVVQVIAAEVKALGDEITTLGHEIDQVAAAVAHHSVVAEDDASEAADSPLATEVRTNLAELTARVDARLQAEYLEANGGLAKTILLGGRPRAQLVAKLNDLARAAAQQTLAEMKTREGTTGAARTTGENDLHGSLALATPAALEFGGRRRILAVLPPDPTGSTTAANVTQTLGPNVTTVQGTDANLTLCVEADGLSLEHIALELVERRRDRVEFAERVHSRTDIAWIPLVSTKAQPDVSIWNTGAPRQPDSQHAMCQTVVL